jgi:NADPH-dependent curcumin reductase CurA
MSVEATLFPHDFQPIIMSTIPSQHKVWILNKAPTTRIELNTFKCVLRDTPQIVDLQPGFFIAKTYSLSNDPAQRLWMDPTYSERRLYVKPIKQGDAIRAGIMATIVASKSTKWNVGDKLVCSGSWAEYHVYSEDNPSCIKAL